MEIHWSFLVLVLMFLASFCFVLALYHRAHGKELDAVNTGALIVTEALVAQGRMMPLDVATAQLPETAFNMGEDGAEVKEPESPFSDLIMARSEEAAEQLAHREVDKVMEGMDEKV